MAKPRYEYCEVADIRVRVAEQLPTLPACKGTDETPAEFWSRVERAGLLHKALALYDEVAAARRQIRRETKKQFDQRIEREGRRAEVKRARRELLASGLTNRETQAELVDRFQPRDGTKTRAWETPDPWQQGRLFKKKKDQQEVLEQIECDEDEDEDYGVTEAENRLHWAERRREERQALAGARRRAWALKMEPQPLSRPAKRANETEVSSKGPSAGSRSPPARLGRYGGDMTAAQLLAELTAQGFSLVAREGGIGVIPARRLTQTQVRAIQKRKTELLALLRAGAPPKASRAPRKQRRAKAEKLVEVAKPAVRPGGNSEKAPCNPGGAPEAVPERKQPKPPLCPSCWQRGNPNCPPCLLAYDSSLQLGLDGVLYCVRPQSEKDRLPWRRCEICNNPFQAPIFGLPNVCPDCRERVT